MGKAPAFMFYVKDWLADPDLQMATSSTRGIWVNALCYMWEARERGRITGESLAMARMLMCNNGELEHFLEEAEQLHFCDVERQENVRGDKILTLTNRRMFREERTKKLHRERQYRYEDRKQSKSTDTKNDAEVTTPLAFALPIPIPKNKTYSSFFLSFWKEYPKKIGKPNAFREWNKIKPDLEIVLSALKVQIEYKESLILENKFCPEWPDPERWIKNQRWLDEISEGPIKDRRMWEIEQLRRKEDGNPKSS